MSRLRGSARNNIFVGGGGGAGFISLFMLITKFAGYTVNNAKSFK